MTAADNLDSSDCAGLLSLYLLEPYGRVIVKCDLFFYGVFSIFL